MGSFFVGLVVLRLDFVRIWNGLPMGFGRDCFVGFWSRQSERMSFDGFWQNNLSLFERRFTKGSVFIV